MDDNYRLIKLISLVGWADRTNGCGLRYDSEAHQNRLTADERTAGHMMCAYYAGALSYHQGNTGKSEQMDRRDLPGFTLDFVTNLCDDAVAALGDMVRLSLALGAPTDSTVLGRQWIEDVTATCWRLAFDNYKDRFGQLE